MVTREDIVREALSWELTRYHSNARIKGVGVDCAQMPLAVYHAVGLIGDIWPEYSPQFMLHRDEELYLRIVREQGAHEIDREQIGPGDFVMWKFGRTYSHGAIVLDPPEVLHAYIPAGMVVRANIDRDEELRTRPARFFSFF